MPVSFKALRSSIKSMIKTKSRVVRSNHIAELPRSYRRSRSSTTCFDENDITDNITESNSDETTKLEVIAFFNECSPCTSLPSSLPCRGAKSVRFSADIDVMEVERSNDDPGDLWYSEADFLAIERQNLKISWQRTDDEKQTIRGLELKVYPSVARQRQETENLAFESVMVEQDNQGRQGVYDPYAIAKVYQENGARQCQLEAHAVGLKDFDNIKIEHEQIHKLIALSRGEDFSESPYGYHSDESGNTSQ